MSNLRWWINQLLPFLGGESEINSDPGSCGWKTSKVLEFLKRFQCFHFYCCPNYLEWLSHHFCAKANSKCGWFHPCAKHQTLEVGNILVIYNQASRKELWWFNCQNLTLSSVYLLVRVCQRIYTSLYSQHFYLIFPPIHQTFSLSSY